LSNWSGSGLAASSAMAGLGTRVSDVVIVEGD
jgi:hypothetical protein